jgi:thioredoxin-dependent peroxiredoxin
MPAKGEIAPDFELLNQNGEPVKLSSYHGKKVLLFAYPKAGTDGCTRQACGFRDAFPRFETSNAVVLGISPDKPKDLLKWKNAEKLPYDLLSDPEHATLDAWGVWGEKTLYGRKYMGVIRSHWLIDENGVIADAQIGVTPKDSVARALKLMK